MFSILKPFIKTALTLLILSWAIPSVTFMNVTTLVLASIVLTILFSIVKPVLNLLFLPVTIVTFGFASLVITVGLLWLSTYIVPGFEIGTITLVGYALNAFWSLVVVAAAISLIQTVLHRLF